MKKNYSIKWDREGYGESGSFETFAIEPEEGLETLFEMLKEGIRRILPKEFNIEGRRGVESLTLIYREIDGGKSMAILRKSRYYSREHEIYLSYSVQYGVHIELSWRIEES